MRAEADFLSHDVAAVFKRLRASSLTAGFTWATMHLNPVLAFPLKHTRL